MEIPQKIKNRATTWSSNFTSGYLPKENGTQNMTISGFKKLEEDTVEQQLYSSKDAKK